MLSRNDLTDAHLSHTRSHNPFRAINTLEGKQCAEPRLVLYSSQEAGKNTFS